MSSPVVAVVGPGGPQVAEHLLTIAREVGAQLAAAGATVVCGGLGGVMSAVAEGGQAAGGTVIGLLPGHDAADGNRFLSVAIPTGLGELRNALVVRAADAVIAVGGGYGTLSEIALALKAGTPVIGVGTWQLVREGTVDDGIVVAADARVAGRPRQRRPCGVAPCSTKETAMANQDPTNDDDAGDGGQDTQTDGATRSGDPAPAGLNDADVPGAAMGSPGGAVVGSPGPGGGGGIPGDADLGGDGDLGGDDNPLRTHTAGGENSG